MNVQLSARITLSLVIGLAILSVVITTVMVISTYTNAQLDSIARPAIMTGATTIVGASSSSSSTSPPSGKQFRAVLTGDNEVPPVDTEATGRVRLIANSQSTLDYHLSLSNLNGVVSGAHIHRGGVETNGPIVATLNIGGTFAGTSASTSGGGGSTMTSTSMGGTITSADLRGPLAGKQVSDLIRLIEDGNAYVNVQTDQNFNGEIRGQLKSLSSSSEAANEG